MDPIPSVSTILKQELLDWAEPFGVSVTEARWEQLGLYVRAVEDYNHRVNLTADTGDAIWFRHMADAMATGAMLRKYIQEIKQPQILDLGAGAGFIGIGLKILWPETRVTLLESSRRKFQFLNWICAQLKTPGLHVALGSAPHVSFKTPFNAVIARALASLPQVLAMAWPLLQPHESYLLAHQTVSPDPNHPLLTKALQAHQAIILDSLPYRLPRETIFRHLTVITQRRTP